MASAAMKQRWIESLIVCHLFGDWRQLVLSGRPSWNSGIRLAGFKKTEVTLR
jgi:hypothetical protein